MASKTGAGINLSAFGVDKRPLLALAGNEGAGVVKIELSALPAFGGKAKLMDPVDELLARWRGALNDLPRPIAVDLALDLQQLTRDTAHATPDKYLWQLTHRPLDFAFYGDAPLTDRVGAFGIRFRRLLADFTLGKDLIEASPAACVELLRFKGSYKGGQAHQARGGWKADNSTQAADRTLALIAQEIGLNVENDPKGKLDSGDFDAVMCALTALAVSMDRETLTQRRLGDELAARCARRMAQDQIDVNCPAPAHTHALFEPFWQSVLVYRR